MVYLYALLGGYLLGSIPTAVLLGRIAGKDPREHGSKNPGASNVARVLGKPYGVICLLVDLAKGAGPAYLGLVYGGAVEVGVIAGGAAVLGHCFPIWLRFKGGKGVATAFGSLLVFAPWVVVLTALIWLGSLLLTRTPAIGSLIAAALFVVLCHAYDKHFAVQVYTVYLVILITIRHQANVRVLRKRYDKAREKAKRRVR